MKRKKNKCYAPNSEEKKDIMKHDWYEIMNQTGNAIFKCRGCGVACMMGYDSIELEKRIRKNV